MKCIILCNNTDDDIEIIRNIDGKKCVLNAKSSIKYKLKTELEINEIFYIKTFRERQRIITKVLGIILAVLISIPMFILNYFKLSSLNSYITLPFELKLNDLYKSDESAKIEIFNPIENSYTYLVKINGIVSDLTIDFSENELKRQVNEYIKENFILFSLPISTLISLFIYSIIARIYIVAVILLFVLLVFAVFCVIIAKENNKIINHINTIYNQQLN